MRVILFRHGLAGDPDPSRWPKDPDRPLSERGVQKTRAAARGLARIEDEESVILTSPFKRAVQTAELIREALPHARKVIELDALAIGGSYREVLQGIAEHAKNGTIILVGHEPSLGKLAGTLLFGAPTALPLKKAGGCAVEFVGDVKPGTGHLRWFLPPKVLRRLGRSVQKAKA